MTISSWSSDEKGSWGIRMPSRDLNLPIVKSAHEDESLSSWFERLAQFYGFSVAQFLRWMGHQDGRYKCFAEADLDAPLVSIKRAFAAATGYTLLTIEEIATRSSKLLWLGDRDAYCHLCWRDDLAKGEDHGGPYNRARWQDPWRVYCDEHRVWLAPHPGAGSARNRRLWSERWQQAPQDLKPPNRAQRARLLQRDQHVGTLGEALIRPNADAMTWAQVVCSDVIVGSRRSPAWPPTHVARSLVLLAECAFAERGQSFSQFYHGNREPDPWRAQQHPWRAQQDNRDDKREFRYPSAGVIRRRRAIETGRLLWGYVQQALSGDDEQLCQTYFPIQYPIPVQYAPVADRWISALLNQWPAELQPLRARLIKPFRVRRGAAADPLLQGIAIRISRSKALELRKQVHGRRPRHLR